MTSTSSTTSAVCCLLDGEKKCSRPSSSVFFGKRMEKHVQQRKLNIRVDPTAKHSGICTYHQKVINPPSQSAKLHRKSKQNDSDNEDIPLVDGSSFKGPKVKLHLLSAASMKRYKKFFKVSSVPGANKHHMAENMLEHFRTIPVNDREIITYFIYTVKTNKNKLDQPAKNNDD